MVEGTLGNMMLLSNSDWPFFDVMQDNRAKYVESTKQAVRLFFNLYYFFLLISFT